jgi:hypothetical protein
MNDKPSQTAEAAATVKWIAAAINIYYGFAKLNGSQFTVLDSELARPLGEVSGFWLTWHYFGYSAVFGSLIAVLEIAAGILLLIPRTTLAGGLLTLTSATPILLIDIFYGVDLGGTFAALVLWLCAVAIVAPHRRRLLAAVLISEQPARPSMPVVAVVAVLMVSGYAFTYWVANDNNRAPTAIDGVWDVVEQTGAAAEPRWKQVFYERNRAHLAVFRGEGRADARHHFEVDSQTGIRVWEVWRTKGAEIMRGRVATNCVIELQSVAEPAARLVLRRRSCQAE